MATYPKRIPVTLLSGFLGAGKTTLLNRILTENHGLKIAVIENEIGEISIDHQLVVNTGETVIEMSNGCICCTSQGDLVQKLGELVAIRDKFDYVVIEATGLANPAPVVETFLRNEDVSDHYVLDGVVTLVDARHIEQHLDKQDCVTQIAFADVLILNKLDLVNASELAKVEQRPASINSLATLHRTRNSVVEIKYILNIAQFDEQRTLAALASEAEKHSPCCHHHHHEQHCCEHHDHHDHAHGNGHCDHHDHTHGDEPCDHHDHAHGDEHHDHADGYESTDHHHSHAHGDEVTSVGIERIGDIDPLRLSEWLDNLLNANGDDIFRMKGIFSVKGIQNRVVIQAVHRQIDDPIQRGPWNDEVRKNQIVFIGRHLDRAALTEGFQSCLVKADNATR